MSLRIVDQYFNYKQADYETFKLNKANSFALEVSGYSSEALWWHPDELSDFNSVPFSTFDSNNNPDPSGANCAISSGSAGW